MTTRWLALFLLPSIGVAAEVTLSRGNGPRPEVLSDAKQLVIGMSDTEARAGGELATKVSEAQGIMSGMRPADDAADALAKLADKSIVSATWTDDKMQCKDFVECAGRIAAICLSTGESTRSARLVDGVCSGTCGAVVWRVTIQGC